MTVQQRAQERRSAPATTDDKERETIHCAPLIPGLNEPGNNVRNVLFSIALDTIELSLPESSLVALLAAGDWILFTEPPSFGLAEHGSITLSNRMRIHRISEI